MIQSLQWLGPISKELNIKCVDESPIISRMH